jgi:hypothetical protein
MRTTPIALRPRWRDAIAQHWPHAVTALLLWCAMLPLALSPSTGAAAGVAAPADEWPLQWQGQSLRPLALTEVERRFADRFPGRIARFDLGGSGELVLRDVNRPTRMLHPAADCWRGIGWQVQAARLERDEDAALWRCFEARRDGRRVRVCERIVGADGQSFTDASAWYWTAALGRSQGPWRAVTQVTALESP